MSPLQTSSPVVFLGITVLNQAFVSLPKQQKFVCFPLARVPSTCGPSGSPVLFVPATVLRQSSTLPLPLVQSPHMPRKPNIAQIRAQFATAHWVAADRAGVLGGCSRSSPRHLSPGHASRLHIAHLCFFRSKTRLDLTSSKNLAHACHQNPTSLLSGRGLKTDVASNCSASGLTCRAQRRIPSARTSLKFVVDDRIYSRQQSWSGQS